jgi:hypothetical protein
MIQIRIKIDVPESTIAYYRLQKQWENEGGATAYTIDDEKIPNIKVPLEKGDIFRVLGGVTDFENGEIIFTADIQKIKQEQKTKSH